MSDLGAPVAMSQEDLDEYMESGKAQLSEPRKISVTELFKTWDFKCELSRPQGSAAALRLAQRVPPRS